LCPCSETRKQNPSRERRKFQRDVLGGGGGPNGAVCKRTRLRQASHHIWLFATIRFKSDPTQQLH
jgi:hypothetical protein